MEPPSFVPSQDFEVTRRRVERDIKEWWWYLEDQLKDLKGKLDTFPDHVARIDAVLENGAEHAR